MLDTQTEFKYNVIFSIVLGVTLILLINYFMGQPTIVFNKE